ncbi:hypothetical protein [Sinosporangium siamense]|uniref:Uncharacterized protein n=1 Tax=Sinosporangium siamense TaxID=1367973 RepID=A0A919V8K6_9ACTN|nr:hypothetical protein [Sinosporangium siamense]GII94548.1 hypothetical protein Ssi02_47790 [Sinosporangium siamense]
MIGMLRKCGVTSQMMYTAGMASIGLSGLAWLASRTMEEAGQGRADRWGIFIGEWVPALFAIGVALRLEEIQGTPVERRAKHPHKAEEPQEAAVHAGV